MIGVREKDGKPEFLLKGIPPERIDRYLKDMLNKWHLIQIEYLFIIEVTNYKVKKFIVIWAPGGNARPYSAPRSMSK